jgi:hypothetical protein
LGVQVVVDPVMATVGMVAEALAVELATGLAERQWRRGRARELTRPRIERMLEGSANQLADALQPELGRNRREAPGEWTAVVDAVRDSLAAVAPLAVPDALALDLRAEQLVDHVRRESGDVRRRAALSEAGDATYDRLLAAICERVLAAVVRLPGFSDELQVATFQDVRALRREIAERPPQAAIGPADPGEAFEARYLDHVVRTLGRLELFGVSRGRAPRTLPFDTAYVGLAVARSGGVRLPDEDDDLTGAGVDVTAAFADHRRVLLRGGAGAGKTTLLRWLAVDAAVDTTPGSTAGSTAGSSAGSTWGSAVPFFVPLRSYARRDFPSPEALPESVAGVIAAEMPPGWVSARLRAGRAMLLVDGLDELEPARRREARAWLDQLVGAYPGTRVVVSARPFAVADDWLAPAGFVTFDLLPLSPAGIEAFLGAWHHAAREQHPGDAAVQEWLEACERGLREQLAARVELRRLAGTPLLCGLLCALYQDRNMHLPRDRKSLYDAALDLLLVRWDEERGIRVDELPWLTKEEQIVLLQRFAYSMVKNHEVTVTREDATSRIAHAMRGLRSHEARAEPVLQRTLERTGLLHEPNPDEVQFVHRTFRDYLAAKEIVDAGDLDFLVEQAHLDHWHDVVMNAVAHARPRERDRVLRRLVSGNAAARADARLANRLRLVAAACLEQADVLDTDEARQVVEHAATQLIPPATLDDADVLARAGPFVLDLLPGPEGLTPQQAACVVRTAAMIGGEGVRERLAEFVPLAETRVIDELLRAWQRSEDPESYARTVLAGVAFGDRSLEVRGWHRVRCLVHLHQLTSVVCYGDFSLLEPLAHMPSLRRLELVQNELLRSLAPLAASSTLHTLHLRSGCEFLQDLSPLAGTTVEELGLHLVAADLRTLRPGRLRRLVINDPRLRDGLDPLPADLDLRELVLDNPPRSRNLRGVERWPQLERVALRGTPRPDDVERLVRLPALRRLDLTGVPAGDRPAVGELLAAVPPHVEVQVEGPAALRPRPELRS